MHVPEVLKRFLRTHDWERVRTYLEALPHDEQPMATIELFQAILRDGYLIARWSDPARRDSFVEQYRAFAESKHVTDLLDAEAIKLDSARFTEDAYLEVIRTLQQAIESKLTADELAWAAVRSAEGEYQRLSRNIREAIANAPHLIDPPNATIDLGLDEGLTDPELTNNILVSNLTLTLKMLAYKNKWYATDGHTIVLPRPVDSTEKHLKLARGSEFLAAVWGQLERSDGVQRFFGGRVTKNDNQQVQYTDGLRARTVIQFELTTEYELVLYVAGERVRQMLFQSFVEVDRDAAAQAKVVTNLPVPPAPGGYVSVEEVHGAIALSQIFFKPIFEVQANFGGLNILEWLRGYSALQKLARAYRDDSSTGCEIVLVEESELVESLTSFGLPMEKASLFIAAVCFGTDRADLFDAPLIRCADGKLCLIVSGAATGNLTLITMSQLASLRADFTWKGPPLEADVIELFKRHGIPAARIHRRVDGKEFECDCVVLWDQTLFLFECKNYSLPSSNPQAEFWFIQDQLDAILQVEHKASILRRRLELATEALGADASKANVVPVVLNGTPFSLPTEDNQVAVYDASALHRFFEQGEIGMKKLQGAMHARVDGTAISLWESDNPTAADLLRQLHRPAQVIQSMRMLRTVRKEIPLSDSVVMVTQVVDRLPSTLENLSRSFGVETEKLESALSRDGVAVNVDRREPT